MGATYSKQSNISPNLHKKDPGQGKHDSADSATPLKFSTSKTIPSSPPASNPRRWTIADDGNTRFNKFTTGNATFPGRQNRWSIRPLRDTRDDFSIDTIGGHSNVSKPPPPPRIHSLSELIDPANLPIDAHIRSPSGNLLAPEQFMFHPARPLSMRERQEEIRDKVRAASRLGEVQNADQDSEHGKRKLKWRVCRCCCFG